jgi:4-amino-4-deoxy-L-arabinose transferase-like glycosyltransferase
MSSTSSSEAHRRTLFAAVAVLSMLLPVALALTVLPTAMSDTRELIAWGRAWPLVTPKHPPLMTWVGYLVDRTLGPSAAAAILVNQVLLGVGTLYLYATLRLMTERGTAMLFAFLFATSIYVVGAPLSYALNADILQITSWPAVVYHFLVAARSNQIKHWLAMGAWSAAAILTKYNVAVLFLGMLVALVWVKEFRGVLVKPGLYGAVILTLLLVSPHGVALLSHPEPVKYAGSLLGRESFGATTLDSFAGLIFGYVFFLAPGWIFILIGYFQKALVFRSPVNPGHAAWQAGLKFVAAVNVAMLVILCVLILSGLHYLYRFDAPYLALATLALGGLVAIEPAAFDLLSRRIAVSSAIVNLALFAGAVVMYGLIASHDRMQEPIAGAAAAILADWNAHYTCGPGYFIGEAPSVYGIGDVASPHAIALITPIVPVVSWFDRRELDKDGAVVVYRGPVDVREVKSAIPNAHLTDETAMTLPLLHTMTGKTITYHYRFIPPQNCPANGH